MPVVALLEQHDPWIDALLYFGLDTPLEQGHEARHGRCDVGGQRADDGTGEGRSNRTCFEDFEDGSADVRRNRIVDIENQQAGSRLQLRHHDCNTAAADFDATRNPEQLELGPAAHGQQFELLDLHHAAALIPNWG